MHACKLSNVAKIIWLRKQYVRVMKPCVSDLVHCGWLTRNICCFLLILAFNTQSLAEDYLSNQFSVKFNLILLTPFIISLAKAMLAMFCLGKSSVNIYFSCLSWFFFTPRSFHYSLLYIWLGSINMVSIDSFSWTKNMNNVFL